jgi:hypothetical protein
MIPHRPPGRPATDAGVRELIVRLARENPGWDYRQIHGELAALGIKIAASTVRMILPPASLSRCVTPGAAILAGTDNTGLRGDTGPRGD